MLEDVRTDARGDIADDMRSLGAIIRSYKLQRIVKNVPSVFSTKARRMGSRSALTGCGVSS
jgi:hypothetical protein